MISASFVAKEISPMAKIDEYKSSEGVRFKAKLMGNTIVDELRGKTVAEYAMAKLKLSIMKQKQHKTKVNISLKWDGFFVYLSDGGQELLHSFPLENISFVWKDPCDDRALGIICSDGMSEKQTMVTKFYGYKTEKLALPLIMALKELFGLRTNEHNDSGEERKISENVNNLKEKLASASDDLLDLKTEVSKPSEAHFSLISSSTTDNPSNWNSFSNVNLFPTFPSVQSYPTSVQSVNSLPQTWQPYTMHDNVTSNQLWSSMNSPNLQQFSNPFSQPIVYPPSNNFNVNIQNPFGMVSTTSMQIPTALSIQPSPAKCVSSKISKNSVDDLFSDLLTTGYNLDPGNIPRQPSKNSLNSNGKDSAKISLLDLKNRQGQQEQIDFSAFERNSNNTTVIGNQKIESSSMAIPLFQFD